MRWNTLAKRIGQNIRTIRRAKDLTQEKAAELSGTLSLRHWQYLENGEVNCTLKSLAKVARALKVDPQELLGK